MMEDGIADYTVVLKAKVNQLFAIWLGQVLFKVRGCCSIRCRFRYGVFFTGWSRKNRANPQHEGPDSTLLIPDPTTLPAEILTKFLILYAILNHRGKNFVMTSSIERLSSN